MKPISDTFIYKNMNRGNAVTNNIIAVLKEGKKLNSKDLDEAFATISRYKFPLKNKVIDDFEQGGIQIVVPPENAKMPTYMPFFLTKLNGQVVAVIDFSIYGHITQTGARIDAKKLYCLMEGAHIAKLYYTNEKSFSQRSSILMKGASAYSNLFIRVLNKKYSLNLNKDKLHKVLFLSSKFFLINIMGLEDNDTTFNYAIKTCGGDASMISLRETDNMFMPKYFADFSTFIKGLATVDGLNLGMDDLTVRGYLESFIITFDSSMTLTLESFPYLIYNMICVMNGAYINNQKLLEQVIGGEVGKIYGEIILLDR